MDVHDAALPAQSTTAIRTEHASRYLQQLCKHFAHKRPTTFDERSGQISLTSGECRLQADDAELSITVETSDASQLEQIQDVVIRHLERFAFREHLAVEWRRR